MTVQETHSTKCREPDCRTRPEETHGTQHRDELRRALYERIARANALADAETEARQTWDRPRYSSWDVYP